MKTTVFAKKVKTNDGKSFFTFVTSLDKKDGSKQYMNVMYSGDDKNKKFDSEDCPVVIEFDKNRANVSCKSGTTKDGKEWKHYTLWLKDYTVSEEKYVDHSLDDFI